MAFIQDAPAAKIPFWMKKRVPVITNMQIGLGKLGDYDGPASRLGGYDDDAADCRIMRNAMRVMQGYQQPMTGVPVEAYRELAQRGVSKGLTVSALGDYGDASSPPTSAADYLKAFTDFSNQALQTYATINQNARIARAQANAPLPAPTPVQRVSNFSRNNTGVLLAVAGGLAAVLIIPRLMRR